MGASLEELVCRVPLTGVEKFCVLTLKLDKKVEATQVLQVLSALSDLHIAAAIVNESPLVAFLVVKNAELSTPEDALLGKYYKDLKQVLWHLGEIKQASVGTEFSRFRLIGGAPTTT